MILSIWAEYYRHAAEAVVAKLHDNYDKFSVQQRLHFAKLAVDNIERLKEVLKEIARMKYKAISWEQYGAFANFLATLESALLRKRYGDTRPASIRRVKEDLRWVVAALDNFRDDLISILAEKRMPMWYSKISSAKLREKERDVADLYWKKFKEPLAVFVYL